MTLAKDSERGWSISGLPANAPAAGMEEKLALFGQFVGDWEIVEARYPQPDGKDVKGRGEIHFRWILEGRGIQDTFCSIDEKTGKLIPAGTTVRFYDDKIDAWHSVWISPRQHVVQPFIARKLGEDIVLDGKTADGKYREKWVFTDIRPDSFRWYSEETHDGAKTWILTEEMHVRRKTTRLTSNEKSLT